MTTNASNLPTADAPPVIDVHAHILPPALLSSRAWAGVPEPWQPSGPTGPDGPSWQRVRIGDRITSPIPTALVSSADRLAAMDRLGIDVQVVSPWMELYPSGLAEASVEAHVRVLNDAVAAEVGADRWSAGGGGRLLGLGMVPLTSGNAAARETRRVVCELGLAGVIAAASGVGLELSDPELLPFWATAAELGAVVMVHPVQPIAPARMQAEALGDLIGHPLETTTAVASLLRSGVLAGHPQLRLLVPHGGGALPALADRIDSLWSHAGGGETGEPPSSALRRLHYDTLAHSDRGLRWLAEFAGPDHLVLGTDYPFATGDPTAVARARRTFDAAELEAVLGRTASGLLRRALGTPDLDTADRAR